MAARKKGSVDEFKARLDKNARGYNQKTGFAQHLGEATYDMRPLYQRTTKKVAGPAIDLDPEKGHPRDVDPRMDPSGKKLTPKGQTYPPFYDRGIERYDKEPLPLDEDQQFRARGRTIRLRFPGGQKRKV